MKECVILPLHTNDELVLSNMNGLSCCIQWINDLYLDLKQQSLRDLKSTKRNTDETHSVYWLFTTLKGMITMNHTLTMRTHPNQLNQNIDQSHQYTLYELSREQHEDLERYHNQHFKVIMVSITEVMLRILQLDYEHFYDQLIASPPINNHYFFKSKYIIFNAHHQSFISF